LLFDFYKENAHNREMESKCRRIAKEKDMTIRKYEDHIVVKYTVTITRQGRIFYTLDEVFTFVSNYDR